MPVIRRVPALLSALIFVGTVTAAAQIPLQSPASADWENLDLAPSPGSSANLIFDTVNSVLQHWPNTRYRNGHNIIPGTIPVGTLLYHGGPDDSVPDHSEWTALDPEHSYPFCGSPGLFSVSDKTNTNTSGCWHLTLVTTRALKVLYFDGSSAANMRLGTLDGQDLLLWGQVRPDMYLAERERIDGLCAWGKEEGIDAYVRMEMDFEVMLCDFHAGVRLLSADFLTAWWPADARNDPPAFKPPSSNSTTLTSLSIPEDMKHIAEMLRLETIRGGSWHNRYPGETRVKLDLTKLVSFYDTALVPSLVPHRARTERWDHRLQNISSQDVAAVTARVRAVLSEGSDVRGGSGIDWKTLFRVVLDRYAERLELLQHLLRKAVPPADQIDHARKVQIQLRIMLTPYVPYALHPPADVANDNRWATPVWRGCATRHTAEIHAAGVSSLLTPSERTLLGALDGTNCEICRVLVKMWTAGVSAGLDAFIPRQLTTELTTVLHVWEKDADALIAWLDWSVWVTCRPACSAEEICYLPTWPFFRQGPIREEDPEDDPDFSWLRPQPRCVRQVAPYDRL